MLQRLYQTTLLAFLIVRISSSFYLPCFPKKKKAESLRILGDEEKFEFTKKKKSEDEI